METVVVEILRPVVKILADHVTNKLRYLISCTTYLQKMRDNIEVLSKKRGEVIEHIDKYIIIDSETPEAVKDWLNTVEKTIDDAVKVIPSDNIGCFDIRRRYNVGKDASNAANTVRDLINENPGTSWDRIRISHGHVDPSISAPALLGGETNSDYDSRVKPFNEALKFLQQKDETQVIALCGMGGVGKTTMMNRLRKHAEANKMFNQILMAVIGRERDMLSVQSAIADYTGGPLTEQSESARAESLRLRFEKMLKDKKKILVILDDVWETFELKSIGLASPLPKGVKLLLTSRFERICKQISAAILSTIKIVTVNVLEEIEAMNFFCRITEVSEVVDLYKIGCSIVQECGYLPLAIKLIAATLKSQEKHIWRSTLERLQKNVLDNKVQEIIEISYNHLEDKEKEIFLLCGLYPEDSNIPIEDLTRYAWGLSMFEGVSTLGDARDRTETCVSNLKSAYLLMSSDGDYRGRVKMHDLVLAFVVGTVYKREGESIINHGGKSKWGEVRMSESCNRISLSCQGMSDFPSDLKFQNLSVLKLFYGDDLLKFPSDFYEKMKKLEVIGYKRMKYPLLPTSSQYSPNLRTLCLNECNLSFDYSCIGNLKSLEVLSFAKSNIRKLPSTFQNLKKLRLLDLTDCFGLVIDDGVLGNFDELEELYVGVYDEEKAISFTDYNYEEIAKISKNLYAFEIEFQSQPPSMLFEKLERFKISLGWPLEYSYYRQWESDQVSYENTLMLNTSKDRLLSSGMNKLFDQTVHLYLEIDGMEHLEDVDVRPPPPSSSFQDLRFLAVKNCGKSSYLFTLNVAIALSRLETLIISQCPVMESIIHIEGNGGQTITFPELRNLGLVDLPELSCLCNNVNEIQLPLLLELELSGLPKFTSIYPKNELATSLLNKQVVVPMLEKLSIEDMGNLKEIWPVEYSTSDEVAPSLLKSIQVESCDRLLNLFPSNFTSLLSHLEELEVTKCASIETLFDIDMHNWVSEIEEGSSMLNMIHLKNLGKLREIWKVRGFNDDGNITVIGGFQAVESITVIECKSFENVFTPANAKFDMGALMEIRIDAFSDEEMDVMPKEEISNVADNILINVAFPSCFNHNFHHLHNIYLNGWEPVEVVFEIESRISKELAKTQQQLLLPYLEEIDLRNMNRMSHVWKCNWNEFLILQKQPFRNLTTIELYQCNNIKYLFSPLMVKLLSNLKKIQIHDCCSMEEVVSNMDDINDEEMHISPSSSSTQTILTLFPHLDSVYLHCLSNLKRIGGGEGGRNEVSSINTTMTTSIKVSQVGVVPWSLCQFSRKIDIFKCDALSSVIPSYALGQMQKLEELRIYRCHSVIEVFETEGINDIADGSTSNNAAEGSSGTDPTLESPRPKNIINVPQLLNLKEVHIVGCRLLQHVFTFSALESLKQLENLKISECKAMEVIVKEENGEQTDKAVVFPRLKSIKLEYLPKLEGFFLGMNNFLWESLESVKIWNCPGIRLFTTGGSMAPMLNFIHINNGRYSFQQRFNFQVTTTNLDQASQVGVVPWSLCQYSREIHISWYHKLSSVIPSYALGQMQKLEVLKIESCKSMIEVFETEGMNNIAGNNVVEGSSDTDPPPPLLKYINNVPQLLNLKKVHIVGCELLQHVFTFSALESLKQLEQLEIGSCQAMKVIVREENNGEHREKAMVFPRLKSMELKDLPNLKGFFLGMNDFLWESLELVVIRNCPGIRLFTSGWSTSPKLNLIHIDSCKYSLEQGLNFQVTTTNLDQTRRSRRLCPATSEGKPWSFHNMIEIDLRNGPFSNKHIISSNELLQLQKLEKIHVRSCYYVDKVFEVALEGINNVFNESPTAIGIPNLREVKLMSLNGLKCIWKSNQSAVLQFPNLTRLSFDNCWSLKRVITSSMAGSLLQLQELNVTCCFDLEVIVKEEEEECDGEVNEITLPCLKSLKLEMLFRLKGFCLGKLQAFSLPLLDTLEINGCPALTVFTKGDLNTPKLNAIKSGFGRRVYVREDLNSVINTGHQEGFWHT